MNWFETGVRGQWNESNALLRRVTKPEGIAKAALGLVIR